MATEIEATFTDINKDELRAKLKAAGAKLLQPEVLMRKVTFDLGEHAFVRVRDEGNRITMSYKHLHSHSLSGMEEICLTVDNYHNAIEFIKTLGFSLKADQETLREEWLLDGAEIDIDTWPWLPTIAEIEGPSEQTVEQVAQKLGFDMSAAIYGSVDEVYKLYYDVTNHDINFMPEIKFDKMPKLLEKRRRPEPTTKQNNL